MTSSKIEITTAWLTQALAEPAGSNRVINFNIENIGDGKGFGGKTLRVHLTWDGPSDLNSIIIKLPVDDPDTLESMVTQDMLLREVLFYQELAADIDLDIPKVYYTEVNGNDFAIVMADLGEVRYQQLKPLALGELEVAMRAAAKLHAAFWNSPILVTDWLSPIVDGTDESRDNNRKSVEHAIELLQQSQEDTTYVENCAKRLLELLPRAPQTTPLPSPVTLAHDDFHGNNLHIQGDDITIFDWQLVAKGTPAMDVANLIASSSDEEQYDQIADHLLRVYHEALVSEGITNYSYMKLQRGFKDAMFFTFLKFLVVLGTINYDVEGGAELKQNLLPKLDMMARNADAEGFIKKLPFLFVIIRIINFFNRIGSWFKPRQKIA